MYSKSLLSITSKSFSASLQGCFDSQEKLVLPAEVFLSERVNVGIVFYQVASGEAECALLELHKKGFVPKSCLNNFVWMVLT